MKILLLALLVSSPVFAATTGTLLLKGAVPRLLSITVTPTTLASTLPLQTTQANSHVADINTKWNTTTGARVTVSSANGGQLRHATVAGSFINYTLQSGPVGVISLATPQSYDAAVAGPQNITTAVGINYTGVPHENLVEGNYTDTVTFTITAL